MRVLIPGALLSYTGTNWVEAEGATLAALLDDLESRYPGIRFRMIDEQAKIRRHIRCFHKGEALSDIAQPLDPGAELLIVQALSGG